MSPSSDSASVTLTFDVGHSSIGWAVLRKEALHPEVLGCGVVTFPTDDCLAVKRRAYRRQRRHVRSIRQRIANMEKILAAREALTEAGLAAKHQQGGGHPASWLLAARLLRSDGAAEHRLSWPLLWDVLRWYAHNRGYNANRLWSRAAEAEDDAEKVKNAQHLMAKFGARTMAETVALFMFAPHPEADPWAVKVKLPAFTNASRYKAQNAAFPRHVVEGEVRRVLEAHRGHLAGLDDEFIRALMEDWRAIPCPGLELPLRYQGGLLFGQLVPRFDNRIITECPFTKEKVPTKRSFEFLRYRWLMQVANIQVLPAGEKGWRSLSMEERGRLHATMDERGYLTPGELKSQVREITGCRESNLDAMLLHPDIGEGLQLLPLQRGKEAFRLVWRGLTPKLRQRFGIQILRGRSLSGNSIAAALRQLGKDDTAAEIERLFEETRTKKGAAKLADEFRLAPLSGRAPFARRLLKQAADEVLAGFHPRRKCLTNDPKGGEDKMTNGCLMATEAMQEESLKKPFDKQTNNHLIRHRLLILERLIGDIAADPALTQGLAIGKVVIEVNRDLREMSGMTAKEMAQDMGLRLSNFKAVAQRLEADLADTNHTVSPGLIRKGRVAMDLGWICPYTQGQPFDAVQMATCAVDKDHIIPYSQRPSTSLDSLVITWPEVNRFKGNRTAYQFIEEEQGKPVPGRPDLMVVSLTKYKNFVESLDVRKGHDDDRNRKRRRKELMLLPKWEEKEKGFLPRDLTVTSQLTRLGAQAVRRTLEELGPEKVLSMPGSVTGVLRTGWNLLGCLAQANPQVKAEDGVGVKTKTEIRGITHLHHALDAVVLGLAAHYLPRNGAVWEMVVKRRHTPEEKMALKALGIFAEDGEGRMRLKMELPPGLTEQICEKLAEKRVVQHLPKDMGGLRVEENTRRVLSVKDGRVKLRQRTRDAKTGKLAVKETEEAAAKVLGLETGKLSAHQGARVITDNFGVAILDRLPEGTPEKERFVIVPWHRVWHRLKELRERNGGKRPIIIRKGDMVEVTTKERVMRFQVLGVGSRQRDGVYFDVASPDAIGRQSILYVGGFLKGKGRLLHLTLAGSTKAQ